MSLEKISCFSWNLQDFWRRRVSLSIGRSKIYSCSFLYISVCQKKKKQLKQNTKRHKRSWTVSQLHRQRELCLGLVTPEDLYTHTGKHIYQIIRDETHSFTQWPVLWAAHRQSVCLIIHLKNVRIKPRNMKRVASFDPTTQIKQYNFLKYLTPDSYIIRWSL